MLAESLNQNPDALLFFLLPVLQSLSLVSNNYILSLPTQAEIIMVLHFSASMRVVLHCILIYLNLPSQLNCSLINICSKNPIYAICGTRSHSGKWKTNSENIHLHGGGAGILVICGVEWPPNY